MAGDRLRLAALTVLGGSLHGRRYETAEVVWEALIGSDPDCHLVVDLPSISPIHARVWADLDASKVHDTHAPRGIFVNGQRVEGEAPLGKNDVLWLGPPGEPESVCVQPRFEPWVERLPLAIAVPEPDEQPEPQERLAHPTGEAASAAPVSSPVEEPVPEDPFFVAPAPAAPPQAADDVWTIAEQASEAPAVVAPAFVAQEPVASAPDEFFVASAALGVGDDEAILVDAEPEPEPEHMPVPDASLPALAIELPPLAPMHVVPPVLVEPPVPMRSSPAAATPRVTTVAAPPVGAASPATPVAASRTASPREARSPRVEAAQRPAAASPRPAGAARRPSARPAPRRSGGGSPGWLWPALGGLAGLAALAAVGVFGWRMLASRVHVDGVAPARAHVGQRATLTGSGFAADPAGNVVLFDDKPARVLEASTVKVDVEVPTSIAESGGERQASVVVRVGSRRSNAVPVTVIQGPRLHGISPEAALPGEEVSLAGAGWGLGATVRFGTVEAQTVAVEPTRIRAIVPPIPGGPGTSAPVVVIVGGAESNAAPFFVGHLPVVTGVSPASASPGDVVQVSGLGFGTSSQANDVRVGGAAALVLAAASDTLRVIVPWVGPGDPARVLELHVQGTTNVGLGALQVAAPSDTIEPRFVAEPLVSVPGRPHAVVTTGIGPAFVLAAAGGRSAAERALEAQNRLNAAVPLLRTTGGLTIEARALESRPMLGLAGRPDVLFEVSDEDAAAYNEAGPRGRGGPVTRARLARWWEAVARDLVLLTIRGERPRFAAALAPEGRALGQLFDAAQKTGRAGVPRQVIAEAKPPLRDGLRLIGLRVPASVSAPPSTSAPPASAGPAAAPIAAPPRLQLDGSFRGRENEDGQIRYLTLTLARGGGSVTYEGGITFTVPLVSLEQRARDQLRFSVRMRGETRYYSGRWDGEKLTGSLSRDATGREIVGSFELRR